MKFDTSSESHQFIEDVYPRVGARNQAVLGRAALFLALGEGLPPEFRPKDSKSVTLNDEQVVGDELKDVVHAALNHRSGRDLDEAAYRQEFRKHFEFGCLRLKQIWQESGNDQAKFVGELLKLAGSIEPGTEPGHSVPALPVAETEVKLKVLVDGPEWSLNGSGTNNGLLVISGQPGTGKSQLALDLLAQLSSCGVRFVFFDMKGELEDDPTNPQQHQNHTEFLQQTGARYVRLIREGLPINPLLRRPAPAENAQVAYEIASLIRCFAPQLGAKQERSISDAYQHLPQPDFPALEQELANMGASGVDLAIVQKIVRFNLFATAKDAVSAEDWLRGSMVIDFKEFGNDSDTKALAVALMLNFLIKKLSRQLAVKDDIQPLKMVLFVDEAHLLLPKESKAGLLTVAPSPPVTLIRAPRETRPKGFRSWLSRHEQQVCSPQGVKAHRVYAPVRTF